MSQNQSPQSPEKNALLKNALPISRVVRHALVEKMAEKMFIENGWLNIAQTCPSPNFNQRPENEISLLVVHNISLPPKQYGGPFVEDFFCNRLDQNAHPYFSEISHLKVSSHLFIRRDGSVIQFVPFNQRAWHAGLSCYAGRDNCNDFSIGIEMEGCDDEVYSDEQYTSLQQVTQVLMLDYPQITSDRITGHEFISPGRKTDPGRAFKWQRLFSGLSRKS